MHAGSTIDYFPCCIAKGKYLSKKSHQAFIYDDEIMYFVFNWNLKYHVFDAFSQLSGLMGIFS